MKDPNVFPAESLKQDLNELMDKRTLNSKTYHKGGNKYTFVKSLGSIHYKKDNKLEEIDLTLQEAEDYFYVNKTLYDLKIFKNFIGYQYESKEGGRVDVKLKEIDGVNISDLNLNIKLEKVEGLPNRVIYRDVLPGLDLFLNLRSGRVQFFKVIKNDSSPVKLAWDVYEDKETKAHFNRKTIGQDGDKKEIELTNKITEISTEETYKHLVFTEEFKGRIAIKDPETRIKSWSNDFTYPVIIDADVEEDIVNTVDDGHDDIYYNNWVSTPSTILGGFSAGFPGYGYWNPAFRFQGIAIPQEATIDDANLKLDLKSVAGTQQFKIYGDDVDDAAAFSNGNLPRNITKTTADATWSPATTGTISIGITGIVQEIVNRTAGAGWVSGNDMRFAMFYQKNYGTHFVGIYDYNKSQAEAAHLIVNYTVAVKVPRHGFVNFQDPGIV